MQSSRVSAGSRGATSLIRVGFWIMAWFAIALTGCSDDDVSSSNDIVSFSFQAAENRALAADVTATIIGDSITATVPFGTDRSALVAAFAHTGEGIAVGSAAQTSGQTANDFAAPVVYRVTAADLTTQDFTATVTVAASPAKQITSFQFLAAKNPQLGSDVAATITGTAITATVPFGTDPTTLIATFATTGASVAVGAAAQTSGQTANDFRGPVVYRVTAADLTTQDFTVAVTVAANFAKEVTSFQFLAASNPQLAGDVAATITGTAITATVPFGTDPTTLIATFATTGARVAVGAAAQTSGQTANDFTAPVVYRVTAADLTTQDFTVTVTIAANPAKEITSFQFLAASNPQLAGDVAATITGTAITATVPFGTDPTTLTASFATTGASVAVGAAAQTSGQTANDFTAPVVYRVTAADLTTQDFTVTVTVAANPAKEITAFQLLAAGNPQLPADITATITGTVVTATVPLGTDRHALVATFAHTGASASVLGTPQTSGQTANDFRSPVVYRVTAADQTTKDFTVIVVIAPSGESYLKASNTNASDVFGVSMALSADGLTLAVSAFGEDSAATGIDGDQADNSSSGSGAVYVFTRVGDTWSQQGYLKPSNTDAEDAFGGHVALSADGNTLAVSATGEDSAAIGIGGNQADNSAPASGAVYIFTRSGNSWTQQAYVKASNTEAHDGFGWSLALAADGNTLAVGAVFEDSASTTNQADNASRDSGAVYVFTRTGTTWSQQDYLKAFNSEATDVFGIRVALSGDGGTLAVASLDDSAATGIDGNELDNTAPASGAVYVFTRVGSAWFRQAYVKASNTGSSDRFGESLALSHDGGTLAVGAPDESSAATGIGGNQMDDSVLSSGAVYVFTRAGTTWSQQAYVKASDTGVFRAFGTSCALASDGSTLAVGGDANPFVSSEIGAVYLFSRAGASWSQQAYVTASNAENQDSFGFGVALSADASTLAVAAPSEGSSATGVGGNPADNSAPSSGAAYVYR